MMANNCKYVMLMPQGRLGNLLFQYQACRSIFPESKILTIDLGINDSFEYDKNFIYFRFPRKGRSIFLKAFQLFFKLLVKSKLFNVKRAKVCPGYKNQPVEILKFEEISGVFSVITLFYGWYQTPLYSRSLPIVRDKTRSLISHKLGLLKKKDHTLVAVHYRFGDYFNWDIYGVKGVVLSHDYYEMAFILISKQVKNPQFILFSDDMVRAEIDFSKLSSAYSIYSGGEVEDLVGIACCDHAIISASTFSWWGAYLGINKERIVIAPKYFCGFKSGKWFPNDIYTDKFQFIEAPGCSKNHN